MVSVLWICKVNHCSSARGKGPRKGNAKPASTSCHFSQATRDNTKYSRQHLIAWSLLGNEYYLVNTSNIESSNIKIQSYVTTDCQSASLSWNKAPIWGLRPDNYYCRTVASLLMKGSSLWWEDESVVYSCCWLSPSQLLSGSSPVGLLIIFYCLRFETSLFVSSCDSQGYGGGIRPRLHTGLF
jgi:hypothetical protein